MSITTTPLKFVGQIKRLCARQAAMSVGGCSAEPKPYTDIPGPRGPLGLGTWCNYLPLVGKYSWSRLHQAGHDKYEQYGAIVREVIMPGVDTVWLFDPKDIAAVLNERDYPQRRSHLALEKYRNDRKHIYRSAGLLPTNGPEWWHLRSELQKEISAPKNVRTFIDTVDRVTQEFLSQLPANQTFDMLPPLSRLNLELTCLLTFGERLNAFAPHELSRNSRSSRLMSAAEVTNSNILPTDQGLQAWRYFETPAYKRIRKAQEYMESVAIALVSQKLTDYKETTRPEQQPPANSCLIDAYIKNPNLELSDVVGMAADLLLAGIDTTSYTSGFAVNHLARNPHVQQCLYEEACRVMPTSPKDPLTADILRTGVGYTRAVLKEVFRLNPISVGVGRILNQDTLLSGYLVPKGTVVVTQNMIACRLAVNFEDPLRFDPGRWLHRMHTLNPYLVLPFGHGMRACIARRMAEQNILVFILRLVRNYEITWCGGGGDDGDNSSAALDVRTLLINKPSEPVSIRLRPRHTVRGC